MQVTFRMMTNLGHRVERKGLTAELAVLKSALYKHKNQLRKDKSFQYLQKVFHHCQRLVNYVEFWQQMNHLRKFKGEPSCSFLPAVTDTKRSTGDGTRDDKQRNDWMESDRDWDIILNGIVLLSKVLKLCQSCFVHVKVQLQNGLFIPFNLYAAAVVSKIWNIASRLVSVLYSVWKQEEQGGRHDDRGKVSKMPSIDAVAKFLQKECHLNLPEKVAWKGEGMECREENRTGSIPLASHDTEDLGELVISAPPKALKGRLTSLDTGGKSTRSTELPKSHTSKPRRRLLSVLIRCRSLLHLYSKIGWQFTFKSRRRKILLLEGRFRFRRTKLASLPCFGVLRSGQQSRLTLENILSMQLSSLVINCRKRKRCKLGSTLPTNQATSRYASAADRWKMPVHTLEVPKEDCGVEELSCYDDRSSSYSNHLDCSIESVYTRKSTSEARPFITNSVVDSVDEIDFIFSQRG